ncbi:MAG TPA: AAA family ATPase [Kamptonema sp.]|nr:AAA family ATPase [Kamptonema sp.]
MLKKLRLQNFKNFKNTELHLGQFTILIGENASGKSNIRDALRFLHGISRGYNLAEIMGEKYVEGGVLQWRGIRGGTREAAFQGTNFALEVTFSITNDFGMEQEATYQIEVNLGSEREPPILLTERLTFSEDSYSLFEVKLINSFIIEVFQVCNQPYGNFSTNRISFNIPILSQLGEIAKDVSVEEGYIPATSIRGKLRAALQAFNDMRFLDLNPEAMRLPSIPGQTILGDRGENLSSVLLDICQAPQKKETLLEWIQELTPMDAKDFEFPTDFTGKTLLTLVEDSGQKISAYSASDGTLRFLAMIAALLGSDPAKIYFFEELDNGIHPTRLHLLIQLIERQVSQGKTQVIATTHSSQLLRLISPKTLESVSLIYRLENRPDAQIVRVLDMPNAQEVLEKQNLAHLHESAWLENVMEFMSDDEVEE